MLRGPSRHSSGWGPPPGSCRGSYLDSSVARPPLPASYLEIPTSSCMCTFPRAKLLRRSSLQASGECRKWLCMPILQLRLSFTTGPTSLPSFIPFRSTSLETFGTERHSLELRHLSFFPLPFFLFSKQNLSPDYFTPSKPRLLSQTLDLSKNKQKWQLMEWPRRPRNVELRS